MKKRIQTLEQFINEGAKPKFVLYTNPNNITNYAYCAEGPEANEVLRNAKKYRDSYTILYQGRGNDEDIEKAKEMFSNYTFVD